MQLVVSLVFIFPIISYAQKTDSVATNTSIPKFATLYIYHPKGDFVGDFKIHLGDSVICKSKYNSKHEIKLYKEGKTELRVNSRQENTVTIDVKFGEKYFLKCRLLSSDNSLIPTIKLTDTLRGRIEYQEIRKVRDSLKTIKALDTVPQRNTIYMELCGQAGIYSFSYDWLFRINKKVKNSVSFGLAIIPAHWDLFVIAPVSYNFLFGKKNNHLELGIGPTFFFQKFTNWEYTNSSVGYLTVRKDYFLFASPKVGYRYQKLHGGLFFKATLSPIINIVQYFGVVKFKNASRFNLPGSIRFFEPWGELGPVLPWTGVSIGYSFDFKKKK